MTRAVDSQIIDQVHGTCVVVDGTGVLFIGPSGSGKSDLALRLMDGGAQLVADDRVDLRVDQGDLVASAPKALWGLLEVREVGILKVPCLDQASIQAVIEINPGARLDRLPPEQSTELVGLPIRHFQIDPWQQSAPAKVRLVSQLVSGSIVRSDD